VRKEFIRALTRNIREALPDATVRDERWRIFVESDNEERDVRVLQRVFGIVSISVAEKIVCDFDLIKKTALRLTPKKIKSFGVKTQRITKDFHMTSQEISASVGEFILSKRKLKVDLTKPDFWVRIELYGNSAYVISETFEGPGGLPVGSARGFIECDYESDNDVLAAWMMLKRGACVTPTKKLAKWSYGNVESAPLAKVTGVTDVGDFCELQKSLRLPLFSPLVGLSDGEAASLLKKVF
jgi:thiamine biosynthesis protein ThiI